MAGRRIDLARLRLRAQLLVPSEAATTVAGVLERVVAVQAQDARAARLGVRARTKGLTALLVERERVEDRSFVRTWAMRGTIHLLPAQDVAWIQDLVAPPLIRQAYLRLGQEGASRDAGDRAKAKLLRLLEDGPMTRQEMREQLARKGFRPRGRQALVQLLFLATLEGHIVTGPSLEGAETMVLVRDWLPRKRPKPPRDPAAELVRRYLIGHGPATVDDFRWWSSVRAADARAGWAAIGHELVEVGPGLWRHRSQRMGPPAGRTVHLLPSFDHYYLGYRDRSHVVASPGAARMSRGGFFFNFVADDGRAVALWKLLRWKDGFDVALEPFARLPARSSIEKEVADIGRFLEATAALAGV